LAGASDSDRLDSWKEIAAHVRRDIRTVQRWEKQEGLPVHRHTHNRLATVHGFRQEIDAWLDRRRDLIAPQPGPHRTFKPTLVVSVAVAVLLAASGLWFRSFVRGMPDPVALKVVPLTTYPGDVGGGAFSPDGSHVAFSWNGKNQDNYDIYVKVLDAETPLRLTTDGAPDGFAAWSPDGRSIAFGRSKRAWAPPASIYVIPSVGGPERRIVDLVPIDHYVPLAGLSWSADGKWLAFPDLSSHNGPFCLYAVSNETGEKRKLTSPPATALGDGLPAFSPDGRLLAFVRATTYDTSDIYVMPAQGGRLVRLTTDARKIWSLAWTPDSRQLVFGSDRENETALWRIPAKGGLPRRVPDTAGGNALTAVSCSLRQLTFTRLVTDENIWEAQVGEVGRSPKAKPTKLISSTRGDSNPQYSPDGTRIAFASDRSGTWEIWVCGRDGSDPVRLTNFRHGTSGWPTWSPDGKRLAFDSTGAGGDEYHLFTIAADGGPPQQLTVEPTFNAAPSWSSDGWIYFEANRSGESQVWKIPQTGGAAERVTKHGGCRPAVSPDGKFVYYARGQDEVWRIPAGGGEETRFMAGLEDVFHGRWAPVDRGFYFVERIGPKRALKFLDFDTSRTAEIMSLDLPWGIFALSVSPDRRSVLYSQIDSGAHDLFMIENYH